MATCNDGKANQLFAKAIKNVHAGLRSKVQIAGENFEEVWRDHKSNVAKLQDYANAMENLSKAWTKSHPLMGNRIEWCRNVCNDYFHDGGMEKAWKKEQKSIYYQKLRDEEIAEQTFEEFSQKQICDFKQWKTNKGKKITLLDVGSCFNPFQNFHDEFDVVAIDLCPATSSGVFMADFLEISVTNQEGIDAAELIKKMTNLIDVDLIINTLHDYQLDCQDTKIDVSEGKQAKIGGENLMGSLGGTRRSNSPDTSNYFSDEEDCKFCKDKIGLSRERNSYLVSSCDKCNEKTEDNCQLDETPEETNIDDNIKERTAIKEKNEYWKNEKLIKDILKLSLGQPVTELPAGFFDVVIFSLFLSYLPLPKMRWDSCIKANRLLSQQGLLLIIESDSAHQNRNSKQIKSWKEALEKIGFMRYKYEKLAHLHCMAFRKRHEVIQPPTHADMMFIPQDFNHETEVAETASVESWPRPRDETSNNEISELFAELPTL